jgi:hypothetical protein
MAQPLCPKCGLDRVRRIERSGLLRSRVLPLFGYFPWECIRCRVEFLFKSRSGKSKAPAIRPESKPAGNADSIFKAEPGA